MFSYIIHLLHHLMYWLARRTGRTVTVKWYERTYEPYEEGEEDYDCEGHTSDEGSRTFDFSDLDPDWDNDATFARVVAKYLEDAGVYETSSSPFSPGSWYSTEMEMDMHTGENSERSYHLSGLSTIEEYAVFTMVRGARARVCKPRKFIPLQRARLQLTLARAL